jgi:hypothetical protein
MGWDAHLIVVGLLVRLRHGRILRYVLRKAARRVQ